MTETCTTCGYWRGLHRWDTMQCPANGHEDGQFRQTTYTEESDELAALRAERDELLKLVSCLSEKAPCARCVNGKDENGGACEFCGGYGFHPAGDIREYMLDARAVLAKYEKE